MKKTILLVLITVVSITGFGQESPKSEKTFNIFSTENIDNKLFIASNSGVMNTPLGFRVGFFGKTGAYLGTRFGKGEVYNSDSDFQTIDVNLFSITTGIIKPVYTKGIFSLNAYAGAGYGQWWPYRWERWTKSGYELEAGIMASYKGLLLNLGANMLDGYKTYAEWDFTVGIGSRF